MPVSVVRVPPLCVPAPWWLLLLAHEVGHHIQYDLLPNRKLVDEFKASIAGAAKATTGSEAEADRWGRWSREIFADMFSVMCMGPRAVRAMLELELTTEFEMAEPRDNYPAPATRLALLAKAADRVSGSTRGTEALGGLVSVQAFEAGDSVERAVLDAALGTLPQLGVALLDLCDVDSAESLAEIDSWRDTFHARADRSPEATPQSARLLISATFAAWDLIARSHQGAELEEARSDLCTRSIKAILEGAPDGERGAEEVTLDDTLPDELLDALWKETS